MDGDQAAVGRLIKNHVKNCIGGLAAAELVNDLREAFCSDIPFWRFGYPSLIDFLTSIPGLAVRCIDGEYYIQATAMNNLSLTDDTTDPQQCEEESLLRVELNNLHLQGGDHKRKVVVKRYSPILYPSPDPILRPCSSHSSIRSDKNRDLYRFSDLNGEYSEDSMVGDQNPYYSSADSQEFLSFSSRPYVDVGNGSVEDEYKFDELSQRHYLSAESSLHDSSNEHICEPSGSSSYDNNCHENDASSPHCRYVSPSRMYDTSEKYSSEAVNYYLHFDDHLKSRISTDVMKTPHYYTARPPAYEPSMRYADQSANSGWHFQKCERRCNAANDMKSQHHHSSRSLGCKPSMRYTDQSISSNPHVKKCEGRCNAANDTKCQHHHSSRSRGCKPSTRYTNQSAGSNPLFQNCEKGCKPPDVKYSHHLTSRPSVHEAPIRYAGQSVFSWPHVEKFQNDYSKSANIWTPSRLHMPQQPAYDTTKIYSDQSNGYYKHFDNGRKNGTNWSAEFEGSNLESFPATNGAGPLTAASKIPTNEQVVKRVVGIVNMSKERSNSRIVEFRYLDIYSVPLPENWLTLISQSGTIFMENFNTSTFLYPNRTFSSAPTVDALPSLELPDRVEWSVRFVAVSASGSIWFRLIENAHDVRYQILCHELRRYYENVEDDDDIVSIESVAKGELYAVRLRGQVVRVRVITRAEKLVTCVAVDEGVTSNFAPRNLMSLNEKFTNTPALAVEGCLVDVNVRECCGYVTQKLEKMILGLKGSVRVATYNEERPMIKVFATVHGNKVNVNERMLRVIRDELRLPTFKIDDQYDIIVLNMENYVAEVNVMTPCYDLLQHFLRKANEMMLSTEAHRMFAESTSGVDDREMYLAKGIDGSWQRVVLKRFIGPQQAVVRLVDFGFEMVVDTTNIVRLRELLDTLSVIPPQAITVNIIDTDDVVFECMKLTHRTNMFSMRIVGTSPSLYARVNLKVPEDRTLLPNGNQRCW